MDKREVFLNCFRTMTTELAKLFPERKGVLLYERLLSKLLPSDIAIVDRHFEAVKNFFTNGENSITFNDRVYIPISEFRRRLKPSDLSVLNSHLEGLRALTFPKEISLVEHKETQENEEEKFLSDIVKKTKETLASRGVTPEASSPAEAISAVASSGVMADIFKDISTKINSREIKVENLLSVMLSSVSKLGGNEQLVDTIKSFSEKINFDNLNDNIQRQKSQNEERRDDEKSESLDSENE